MTETLRVACIPGDGVGPEVVPEARRVLEAAAGVHGGLGFDFSELEWGCDLYRRTGALMPQDGLAQLSEFDSILFGAVGAPDVPDHVSLWGLLIPIRRAFEQYVNVRPVKLLTGVRTPLRDRAETDIDFVVVRENSEGEYSDIGGRIHAGTEAEAAVQIDYFSRRGCERAMRFAFELAAQDGRGEVACATKSNGIIHSMPFWDEIFAQVSRAHPDIRSRRVLADALAAYVVTRPESLDVVVASNLMGDVISEVGAAVMGGVGIAPSANLNPERGYPSMFEPVHGSAPDIAGRNIANPVGEIWSAKLLLDFQGHDELGAVVLDAVGESLSAGIATPDLGGTATTRDLGDAIVGRVLERA
jgi:tartrate dehydrogenase/decarboxylase / D-malate dehydrogenase